MPRASACCAPSLDCKRSLKKADSTETNRAFQPAAQRAGNGPAARAPAKVCSPASGTIVGRRSTCLSLPPRKHRLRRRWPVRLRFKLYDALAQSAQSLPQSESGIGFTRNIKPFDPIRTNQNPYVSFRSMSARGGLAMTTIISSSRAPDPARVSPARISMAWTTWSVSPDTSTMTSRDGMPRRTSTTVISHHAIIYATKAG